MTILAALLLAILAFFGFRMGSAEPMPPPAEFIQTAPAARRVVLDEETYGHLHPAESVKLLRQTHRVLEARLGPKYDVTNLATGPEKLLAVQVVARGSGGYGEATLRKLLTSTGVVDIAELVTEEDLKLANTTLAEETKCLEAWHRLRQDPYLENFNGIRPEDGGPPASMRWVRSGAAEPAFRLVKRPLGLATRFGNRDLEKIRATSDANGNAALAFGIKAPRQADFEAFTARLQGKQLAIIVGEEILTAPEVTAPLRTGCVLTGGDEGFTDEEVRDLVILMNHPLHGIYLRD